MMRLPAFAYRAPTSALEVARVLAAEGPSAMVVAGGTDLYPNMKRRHQTPKTVVALKRVTELKGICWHADGSVTIGAGELLRAVERDAGIDARLPALAAAVRSISTPLLRNMATLGGNVCLDTRCNYYNQTWEWRRAINFCMKCDGDTCWVAPSSPRCWAVNSSDSVPVLMALGATARLVGPQGERTLPVAQLFKNDGIDYLTKQKDEVLTHLVIPSQGRARSVYRKVRRRGAFDFPVAAVAARVTFDGDRVASADIVLNAVTSAPLVATDAQQSLLGQRLTDDLIAAAAEKAARLAKPLDNTDHLAAWRKKVVQVEVRRALASLWVPRPSGF
jgi:4-hydroxybenzoyl-CoA reductase subunit beta